MHLRFEIEIDDILAFHRYHFAHSKSVRNQKFLLIGLVAAIAIPGSLIIESDINSTTRLALAVAFSVVFGIIFHVRYGSTVEGHVKKLIAEGSNAGMFGSHELTIKKTFLVEKTDVNESRHAWSAVERVIETDDHAFIYLSSVQAHVIPKHRVKQGDYDSFIEKVREQIAAFAESS